ncbi:MAG: hypothetical protein ACAH95_17425 [Fimbriimonas sp.]
MRYVLLLSVLVAVGCGSPSARRASDDSEENDGARRAAVVSLMEEAPNAGITVDMTEEEAKKRAMADQTALKLDTRAGGTQWRDALKATKDIDAFVTEMDAENQRQTGG